MARGIQFDYLHNMRFRVQATEQYVPLNTIVPEAGFSSVGVPEASIEAVEYKEGQHLYTRKYPGHTTFNNITMARGVARRDTAFWEWLRTVIQGPGEYRTHLAIYHYHRADTLPGPSTPPAENLTLNRPARVYHVYQAFPVRHRFSSDLDATDSAVSIAELEIAYEHVSLEDLDTGANR